MDPEDSISNEHQESDAVFDREDDTLTNLKKTLTQKKEAHYINGCSNFCINNRFFEIFIQNTPFYGNLFCHLFFCDDL